MLLVALLSLRVGVRSNLKFLKIKCSNLFSKLELSVDFDFLFILIALVSAEATSV